MPYKDPEKARAYHRTKRREYYAANPAKHLAAFKAYCNANPEKRRIIEKAWRTANPEKYAYQRQKYHAKLRGMPFMLTFQEWCAIWHDSGKFAERGCRKGQYVMARFCDKGGYESGNVRIITCGENTSEGHKFNPQRMRGIHKSSHG